MNFKKPSRRHFLKAASLTVAGLSSLDTKSLSATQLNPAATPHDFTTNALATNAVAANPFPVLSGGDGGVIKTMNSPFSALKSVDLGSVRWTNGFWAERFKQCREVTLPYLLEAVSDPQRSHALTNLRIAAGVEKGEFVGTNWQDEFVHKWLEAASYVYGVTHDERLDQKMDEIINVIAKAQQPDGYLASQIIVRGWKRFQKPQHHELYVMGHLITAACAHHRSTGKTNFLNVAVKVGDYLHKTFITRDPTLAHFGFNPSYIMALVELYRTTVDKKYLEIAGVFVDMRGSQRGGTDQNQDRVPLRQEKQVVGHGVFATYLYSGAADVYMETGEAELIAALERLWLDLAAKKTYVNGGITPLHQGLSVRAGKGVDDVHEAVGDEYELPNSTAYNETCSSIGSFMWNWRMLNISGAARHADMMENTLYNAMLPGIGLDGTSWFYTNPLRWHGADHTLRSLDSSTRTTPGLTKICCPSNLLRTVASLHGYAYSISREGLWTHLYGANDFDGKLFDGSSLKLTQQTEYPWDGAVKFTIQSAPAQSFALRLRIPAWANGATIKVNNKMYATEIKAGSYAQIERRWSGGDTIELSLPMRARLIEGNPRIEATRNQVAVMRGPVLYCLESADLSPGIAVDDVHIPRDIKLIVRRENNSLNGVALLEGEAQVLKQEKWSGELYREAATAKAERCRIRLIPYYAWNNRGTPSMSVWLPLA